MKTFKHKSYYDNVYDMRFVFLLNMRDEEGIKAVLSKHYPETWKMYKSELQNDPTPLNKLAGKVVGNGRRQVIIITKMPEYNAAGWFGALTHECVHAALETFNQRGVEVYKTGDNEHLAYYTDMLVTQALE